MIYYQGRHMNIDEYVDRRLTDREKEDTEFLWNVIAEYVSSCGIEPYEVEFMHKNGFTVWDFVDVYDLLDAGRRYYRKLEEEIA